MAKYRYNRIGEEIKRELADILMHDVKDPDIGLVSITAVDVTSDLQQAKVYFSVMGNAETVKKSTEAIKRSSGFIRRELARKVSLRHTPELQFHYDDSIEHGIRISQLLNEDKRGNDDEKE